ADGVPVVFHDRTLRRMLGAPQRVSGVRWADLCSLRIGGAAAVPRLDEALAAWPQVRFNIDIKADAAVLPCVRLVRQMNVADRLLLASFSDARLARLRAALGPQVATSIGTKEA